MKPTLHDVARQTGLSVATVSRALHRSDSPNVSAETRRRVSEVARRIGYHPNLAGRMLSTGRSHTVSYWTFDAFSSYYAMVGAEISREATRRGYIVVMNSTDDPSHALAENETTLRASPALHSGFDGIIACDVAYSDNSYAAGLRDLRVPFVGIGLNYPKNSDYVGLDLYAGAVEAVRHLVASGCRHIAMLCDRQSTENDPRAQAYTDVLRTAGMHSDWILVGHHNRGEARAVAAALHSRGAFPDAIFCLNDNLAVGCYRGLCDAGVRVPDDIMLIGCDGTQDAEYQACPITSIVAPVAQMCALAWNALEARIAQPNAPPSQTVLSAKLIVRASTRGAS